MLQLPSTQFQPTPSYDYDSTSTGAGWPTSFASHSGVSNDSGHPSCPQSSSYTHPQFQRYNHKEAPFRGVAPPDSPPISPHSTVPTSFSAMSSANVYAPRSRSSSQYGNGPFGHVEYADSRNESYPQTNYPGQTHSDSRTTSRPVSPNTAMDHNTMKMADQQIDSQNSIVSYLQLPETISNTKGSLAEFASQITCLFWFESSQTLTSIEDSQSSPLPTATLTPDAIPSTGFLKWVTTILSTTQVTQNVILLALLFIHRLKKQNPTVKGKPGSEYRLLTVALMLGNKFLDDNTYTNKTWAEVSGISVHEIHVMEVEFLSHMKYNLYTSCQEWLDWHRQLAKFWAYFDRASRALQESRLPSIRPTLQIPYALPSPPASTTTSPPFRTSPSPSSALYPILPQIGPMSASPVGSLPEVDVRANGRKRSYASAYDEPPPKRQHTYSPHSGSGLSRGYPSSRPGSTVPTSLPTVPRLPMPSMQGSQTYTPAPTASSTIYTPTSTMAPVSGRNTPVTALPPINWVQAVNTQFSIPGHEGNTSIPQSSSLADRQNLQGSFSNNSRQASPTASAYPSTFAHTSTHNQLSPSYFLTQRESPYRPVRNIRTLLVAPPSESLQNPTAGIPNDQMRWHPIGKHANETKRGPLPYLHQEAWPPTQQNNQWPPMYHIQPTV